MKGRVQPERGAEWDPSLQGKLEDVAIPLLGWKSGQLAKWAVRAAKREEREVAAKSSERGLSLAEDALGHTKDHR